MSFQTHRRSASAYRPLTNTSGHCNGSTSAARIGFLISSGPQVGEIHDLDRVEDGKRGVFYTKRKPLNLAAFEE